jgi:ubiquinone/menaquinone biosynthesis C-methylase UbiE
MYIPTIPTQYTYTANPHATSSRIESVMTEAIVTVPDQRMFWDSWHERHAVASHTDHSQASLQAFVDAMSEQSHTRVLEVGCGQGREAISLARRGFTVSAFDHSEVAISIARKNAIRAGCKIEFIEHDMTRPLPYTPKSFGGAFAHLSLHYFDDMTTQMIFNELQRVLGPGGVLFFTVRSIRDPLHGRGAHLGENIFCLKGHVRHFLDISYIKDILSEWDIRLTECYDTSHRTVNPGVFIRVLAVRV